jgi:hypothetical protein
MSKLVHLLHRAAARSLSSWSGARAVDRPLVRAGVRAAATARRGRSPDPH